VAAHNWHSPWRSYPRISLLLFDKLWAFSIESVDYQLQTSISMYIYTEHYKNGHSVRHPQAFTSESTITMSTPYQMANGLSADIISIEAVEKTPFLVQKLSPMALFTHQRYLALPQSETNSSLNSMRPLIDSNKIVQKAYAFPRISLFFTSFS